MSRSQKILELSRKQYTESNPQTTSMTPPSYFNDQLENLEDDGDRYEVESESFSKHGVSEATVLVSTALGSVNLEYFFWRAIGNVNCKYCGSAPNVSGLHKR
ncbi:hypothetical protein FQA39_LY04211 [Lamprigera yunnana]|nr:hypothetical protein FQA39_LY04211 [Lamprigera yunnana]